MILPPVPITISPSVLLSQISLVTSFLDACPENRRRPAAKAKEAQIPTIAKRASNKITALTLPSLGKKEKAPATPAKSPKKAKVKIGLAPPVPRPMADVVCSLMKFHPAN
jgi:hypothetical protein